MTDDYLEFAASVRRRTAALQAYTQATMMALDQLDTKIKLARSALDMEQPSPDDWTIIPVKPETIRALIALVKLGQIVGDDVVIAAVRKAAKVKGQ